MIASASEGKGIEAFLPTFVRHHRSGKRFQLPLFPGYVFCRLDLTRILTALTIPGVFSVVSKGNVPEPIPDQEIEQVKTMLRSGLSPCIWPYVSAGQEIFIDLGPLRGITGTVIDANDERWLVVSIHLLQRSLAVRVERASVSRHSFSTCVERLPIVA